METLVFQQFLREVIIMGATTLGAYVLVGGLIYIEKQLKKAIIQSALG